MVHGMPEDVRPVVADAPGGAPSGRFRCPGSRTAFACAAFHAGSASPAIALPARVTETKRCRASRPGVSVT